MGSKWDSGGRTSLRWGMDVESGCERDTAHPQAKKWMQRDDSLDSKTPRLSDWILGAGM
jgi:hypothetical protein